MGDRILIVDDEEAVRTLLRDIVLQGGADREIDEAEDGLQALEKLGAREYQLVLTDISMPRMNGIELLRAIHKEGPRLPAIAITALGDEDTVLTCFSAGAWDYITKPFRLEHVRAAVRRSLVAARETLEKPGDLEITSMGPGWLEITAVSELEYVYRFRRFTEILLEARVVGEALDDIRMAVEEIGRNAVEWGNRFDAAKRVHLGYRILDDRVILKVEDEGLGFNPDGVSDPSADPVEHAARRAQEGKRPGGYGIRIVRQTMDEVSYADDGKSVVMVKYLPRDE